MRIRIEFDGTGDGVVDTGIHFISNVNDYTLCGVTLDGDPSTGGSFKNTFKKVDCIHCIGIIEFCKSIKKSEYITTNP